MERTSTLARLLAVFMAAVLATTLSVPSIAWADDPVGAGQDVSQQKTPSVNGADSETGNGNGSGDVDGDGDNGSDDVNKTGNDEGGEGGEGDLGNTPQSGNEEDPTAGDVPTAQSNEPTAAMVAEVTAEGSATPQSYPTFAAAYAAAADGATIKLLTNTDWVAESSEIKSDALTLTKSLTLDLNGCTLILKKAGDENGLGFGLKISDSSLSLTIKDSTALNDSVGSGKLTTKSAQPLIAINKANTLTLESGTLESSCGKVISTSSYSCKFIMSGGKLITSGAGTEASGVLHISNCDASITGGTIENTANDPKCALVYVGNKNAKLNISGGSLVAKDGKRAIYLGKNPATVSITGGNFGNGSAIAIYSVPTSTPVKAVVVGSNVSGALPLSLPSIELNAYAVVDICSNVTIGAVRPTNQNEVKSFSDANSFFSGKYGNDFGEYISDNGWVCQKQEDSDYYSVLEIKDAKPVAIITNSGVENKYYTFEKALAAVKRGDTLTLQQNVINKAETSYVLSVADATIDLNGCSITASSASEGLKIYPDHDSIQVGDTVKIEGAGSIVGKERGIYAYDTSVYESGNVYTLDIASTVSSSDSNVLAVLATPVARLKWNEANDTNYAARTNATVKTEIGGKTYLYYSAVAAINAQPEAGGTVTLLADSSIASKDREIVAPGKVVLDLNGKTLSGTVSGSNPNALYFNGNDLTIKNGTLSASTAEGKGSAACTVLGISEKGKNNAKLTLEGLTVDGTYQLADKGWLTAFTVNGILTGVEVNLNNCDISANVKEGSSAEIVGVYFPVKDGVLNITDTTITAQNAVQVKGGTVTISESEPGKTVITSTGEAANPGATQSGSTNTGDGIYVEDTYGYAPTVIVKSGTVKSKGEGTSALNYHTEGTVNPEGAIKSSGGTYSDNSVTKYFDESAKDIVALANANGTFSVMTEDEALDAGGAYVVIVNDEKVYYTDKKAAVEANGGAETGVTIVKPLVTFIVEGMEAPDSQRVESGTTATKPADPVRKGYVFQGWYNGEEAWDFSKPVTDDLELTARWALDTSALDKAIAAANDALKAGADKTDAAKADLQKAIDTAKAALESAKTPDDVQKAVADLEAAVKAFEASDPAKPADPQPTPDPGQGNGGTTNTTADTAAAKPAALAKTGDAVPATALAAAGVAAAAAIVCGFAAFCKRRARR
ncbi:MAG: InlB B-repeat-containing protein [Eggerthellaceae bacterium]|nr:InlB B-repeat-containing protein [Eggerthellaceae bacterium]